MPSPKPVTAAEDPNPPPTAIAEQSLFFDFDGTLVALEQRPDAVVVSDALSALLDALMLRLPGRVAIVSGRSIAQLDALLGDRAHRLAIAGSHGAEQRTPSEGHVRPDRDPALGLVEPRMRAFAEANGLVFEAKSLGYALHYRLAPAMEAEAIALAQAVADEHRLTLQRGKMMVEVRSAGDKGTALKTLMSADAMAGTQPLFFGDDVTDEDGFIAAAALGGAGVLVGAPRETAALYRVDDVMAVHAWISTALGAKR